MAAIAYAKTLLDDVSKVFVGGILATLMSAELEAATGIKPMTGLLNDSAILGFEDHVNIDLLTPDYSILDLLEHHYPMSERYIIRATRGCGMKCSFCAVQKLEPDCVDYLSLQELMAEINEKYGERRDLVLMDNNILKSASFFQIVKDIEDLGYGRGAVKINPKTGKEIQVHVDIHSGLDMNFLTEPKMEALVRLANCRPPKRGACRYPKFDHRHGRTRCNPRTAVPRADQEPLRFHEWRSCCEHRIHDRRQTAAGSDGILFVSPEKVKRKRCHS